MSGHDSSPPAPMPTIESAPAMVTCSVRGSVAPLLDVLSGSDVIELDSHEKSLEEVFFGEFEPEPELHAHR
jgi:ABC-2 type transport system ATP-binding protein